MSVAYIESTHVAHLMEWRGPGSWRSRCRVHIEIDTKDYTRDFTSDWLLRFVDYYGGNLPSVRWCSWCVRIVERDVLQLTRAVLVPAGLVP